MNVRDWLRPGVVVPVDAETTAALVAELQMLLGARVREGGGPAFPSPVAAGPAGDVYWAALEQMGGLTIRDYFIAHAPAEPQVWFEPVIGPCPAMPKWPEDLNLARLDFRDYGEAYTVEKHPAAREHVALCVEARKAIGAWEAERRRQSYIQWPAAWADAMLEQRGKS